MVSLPIVEDVVNLITAVMTAGGLGALFALMAVESFGIPPLPSEIILPFAGFLVATGAYSFPAALAAAVLGGVVGAFAAYLVGRYGRDWLERSGRGRLRLDPKHLKSMDDWFARRGESTVLFARLLPVLRAYISYPAGTARMDPVKFGAFTAVGAVPFAAALLYLGFVLRSNWSAIVPYFHILDGVVAAVIVLGLLYLALRWSNVISSGFPPKWVPKNERTRPSDSSSAP
jgi:membrane protein DedA with SNARE-associated domain